MAHGADASVEAAGHAEAAAHGGEAAATFPPFDPALFSSQLVWFALCFGALYLILSRMVLPKVAAVLEARAGAISSDLDQAAQKSAAADAARVNMERAIAKARADARTMIEAARADMAAKLSAEQEQAEARLSQRINAAEAKIDAARAKALGEVGAIAETLARDIVERLTPAPAPRPRAGASGEA
jgi:F-type H+-transporting ATPase subunit b